MAKRFTDTEIWKKRWFRELTPAQKCFVRYMWDDCNIAGIWEADISKAEFLIGEKIGNPNDFLPNDFGIVELNGGEKWFLPKFIEFQYPNGIKGNKKMLISIRAMLEKYNLLQSITDQSPIDQRSIQDKDMDKDIKKEPEEKTETNTEKVTPPELNASVLAFFKKFMELYPKGPDRVVPGSAKIEYWFRDHQKNGADFALLISAVKKYRNSKTVSDGFIMNPMNFLKEWPDWVEKDFPRGPAKEIWTPDPHLVYGPCTRPGCAGVFQEFSSGAKTKSECSACHDPYIPPAGVGDEARRSMASFKMQTA